jgi:hypothetical protein
MTKLTDMTLPKEKKKSTAMPPVEMEREKYPYGLRLSLDTDQVKKLGAEDLDVKAKVRITALASVVSKRVVDEHGGKRVSVELQIEKMTLSNSASEDVSTEERIKGLREKK